LTKAQQDANFAEAAKKDLLLLSSSAEETKSGSIPMRPMKFQMPILDKTSANSSAMV